MAAPPPPFPFNLDNLLKYDTFTYVLVIIAAGLAFLAVSVKPQPLAHPLLFGRQADMSKSRKQGESAVYRNYGIGHGSPLAARPKREIRTALDLVQDGLTNERTLWSAKITNAQLKERVSIVASGLVNIAGLVPKESNVLLLLNPSLEFLLVDLALSSLSVPSFTTAQLSLVSSIVGSYGPSAVVVTASYAHHVLELLADEKEIRPITVIVVGEEDVSLDVRELGRKAGVKVSWWEDVENAGRAGEVPSVEVQPSDVFTVSFFSPDGGPPEGAQLTHENLTSGVVAIMSLFPAGVSISPSDSILSAFPLSTAYGRAIAYAALFGGASFATLESAALVKSAVDVVAPPSDVDELIRATDLYNLPPPTVLFLNGEQLTSLGQAVLSVAGSAPFFLLAWRHKLAAASHGALSNKTFWDEWFFDRARKQGGKQLLTKLRQVVVAGGLSPQKLRPSRLLLSLPIVLAHTHPLVCGPVTASHPADVQFFRYKGAAHVGPPSASVEIKIAALNSNELEGGGDPVGELLVRGPAVGQALDKEAAADAWLRTGDMITVQANGTVVVLRREDVD